MNSVCESMRIESAEGVNVLDRHILAQAATLSKQTATRQILSRKQVPVSLMALQIIALLFQSDVATLLGVVWSERFNVS